MGEELKKTPTPVGFKEALAQFLREVYDPGVEVKALALMGVGPLVRLDMLGGPFGVIHASSDSWLSAVFRSQAVMPPEKRREVEKLFLRERFRTSRCRLRDDGEVALEVNALRPRGNLRSRLQIVNKEVFHRIRVLDRRIGRRSVPRPARVCSARAAEQGKR